MARTRPWRRIAPLATACLLLALAPQGGATEPCPSADARADEASAAALEEATLCLVNRERALQGMRPLQADDRLYRAAAAHSRDMVRHRYFSHTSSSGATVATRVRATGYMRGARGWAVGENLAWGSHGRSTPRAAVRGWMRSAFHRANILSGRFRDLGVGVAAGAPTGARGAATYTLAFGNRL